MLSTSWSTQHLPRKIIPCPAISPEGCSIELPIEKQLNGASALETFQGFKFQPSAFSVQGA